MGTGKYPFVFIRVLGSQLVSFHAAFNFKCRDTGIDHCRNMFDHAEIFRVEDIGTPVIFGDGHIVRHGFLPPARISSFSKLPAGASSSTLSDLGDGITDTL